MRVEVVSLVVESILAVLALIIAVLQFNGEQREWKAKKEEEKNREDEKAEFKVILDKLNDLDFNILEKSVDEINNISSNARNNGQGKNPTEVVEIIDRAIEEYKNCFLRNKDKLEELYRILLANEDRFPMAHGYGRYIEDLRVIMNYDGLVRQRRIAGYDNARVEFHYLCMHILKEKGGTLERSDGVKLENLMEKMIQGLEPMLAHADRIENLMRELHNKYDKYKKDVQHENS